MGSRRLGLARTQALIQQLKRDLTMGGTTFVDTKLLGKSYTSATGGAGAGLQSGSITAPTVRVQEMNGEVLTTIALDLQGLSGSNGATFVVIGNAESPTDPAFLYQHSDAVNGILYKAELSCIELGDAGVNVGATLDFALSASTLGTYGQGTIASGMGDPFVVAAPFAAIAKGQTLVDNLVNSSDDGYVYLVNGTAGSGSAGQYTAGKIIIRLYGHKDF